MVLNSQLLQQKTMTEFFEWEPPAPNRLDYLPQQLKNNMQNKKNKKSKKLPTYCVFCKNNGKDEKEYTNHVLKDLNDRVICKTLYDYVCPICKNTGPQAHTITHCPYHPERLKKQEELNKIWANYRSTGSSSHHYRDPRYNNLDSFQRNSFEDRSPRAYYNDCFQRNNNNNGLDDSCNRGNNGMDDSLHKNFTDPSLRSAWSKFEAEFTRLRLNEEANYSRRKEELGGTMYKDHATRRPQDSYTGQFRNKEEMSPRSRYSSSSSSSSWSPSSLSPTSPSRHSISPTSPTRWTEPTQPAIHTAGQPTAPAAVDGIIRDPDQFLVNLINLSKISQL